MLLTAVCHVADGLLYIASYCMTEVLNEGFLLPGDVERHQRLCRKGSRNLKQLRVGLFSDLSTKQCCTTKQFF